jgi:hypothetical protein
MSDESPATKAEIRALQSDVGEMKGSLAQLAAAYTRLAVLEERQANSKDAHQRAFELIDRLTLRIASLEAQAPIHKQSSDWVQKAIGWVIAAVIGAAVTANVAPRRDVVEPPVIERRQ